LSAYFIFLPFLKKKMFKISTKIKIFEKNFWGQICDLSTTYLCFNNNSQFLKKNIKKSVDFFSLLVLL